MDEYGYNSNSPLNSALLNEKFDKNNANQLGVDRILVLTMKSRRDD